MANNKISKNLSGPERWKQVAEITGSTVDKKSHAGRFKQHDFANWTPKQKETYATQVTGIRPDSGRNQQRKAHSALTQNSKFKTARKQQYNPNI